MTDRQKDRNMIMSWGNSAAYSIYNIILISYRHTNNNRQTDSTDSTAGHRDMQTDIDRQTDSTDSTAGHRDIQTDIDKQTDKLMLTSWGVSAEYSIYNISTNST